LIFGALGLVFVVFLAGWMIVYRSPYDPKNVGYILWKSGLYKIDLDVATETMVGDTGRFKLVIGKTPAELRRGFGFLLEPSQASQYLRGCYQSSPWKDRKVLFIRKSPWMVVFTDDKATDLVLVKGGC
jgi:hypothetical protein